MTYLDARYDYHLAGAVKIQKTTKPKAGNT